MTLDELFRISSGGPKLTEEDFDRLRNFVPQITPIARSLIFAFGGRFISRKQRNAAHCER